VCRARISRSAEPCRQGLMRESQLRLTQLFGERPASTLNLSQGKPTTLLKFPQVLSLPPALSDSSPLLPLEPGFRKSSQVHVATRH
jgi:hypothetical protein